MEILLTNDDGIYADGIYSLYEELTKIGRVTVVAPSSQRSSVGHGITLAYPIWSQKVKRKNRFFGHGISGTPADCVKFAIAVLMKRNPDVIVSGINLGTNDGCSVFYSGTVAAAREGALIGIPSLAISLATFVKPDYSYAAKFGAKMAKNCNLYGLPKGTFLNINVPNVKPSKIKGICTTKQGTIPIHGIFHKKTDPNLRDYYWMSGRLPSKKKNRANDTYALNANYITITPIQSDSTDHDFLEKLKAWKI